MTSKQKVNKSHRGRIKKVNHGGKFRKRKEWRFIDVHDDDDNADDSIGHKREANNTYQPFLSL